MHSIIHGASVVSSLPPHSTPAGWEATFSEAVRLQRENRWEQALALLLPLAQRMPREASVQNLAAVLLAQHGRLAEAVVLWQRVLALDLDNAGLVANLGRASWMLGRKQQALEYFSRAVQLQPQEPLALLNMGAFHQGENRLDEALLWYERVLAIDPNHVQALFNSAQLHADAGRFERAHELYRRVLVIDPGHLIAQAQLIFTQHYLERPDPQQLSALARRLGAQCAEHGPQFSNWLVSYEAERPLRIGLLSADLHDHPVGFFIEGLLTHSTGQAVTWIAYANQEKRTALTERIAPAFSAWNEVLRWSDDQLAARIRDDRVDILLDLSGMSSGHRLGVLARRPAPVQVNWLGYFGTTGLPGVQAVIADPVCVPASEEQWFSERVWRMPVSRYCFTPPKNAPEVAALPALRQGGITFSCFQTTGKINPRVISAWARITKLAPTARWRIRCGLTSNEEDRRLLTQRLVDAGISADRFRVDASLPRLRYFASYGEIDVALDTFPYPGGTTSAEALWMGVPTLTLSTPGMLGRQGEQIMAAAGLAEEWVCFDEDAYVARAVALAEPAAWPALAEQRKRLRAQALGSALFDNARFSRDWHDLIREIWRDACAQALQISTELRLIEIHRSG
ncbi:tetratricopeptide repeat protein [Ottowia thiooxydans]|uniref:O-linked N-acetylglucosamine transferase, SPINDLY family protein n=1 Tax=Ottowia thiooxydans TaxID=219182 RepID=UPI00068880C8|nr:tetratricopeptide repeat protein [Ottowia thiooxydans]